MNNHKHPTAKDLGFDKRSDRSKKLPAPSPEILYHSVEAYQARRYAPIDRYLKSTPGTSEAISLLACCFLPIE